MFAEKIVKEHKDVDGIFVITDLVAVGVLAHFNEQPIVICSRLSLQKSDYELFAQVTHDKRMMEQFTLFTS